MEEEQSLNFDRAATIRSETVAKFVRQNSHAIVIFPFIECTALAWCEAIEIRVLNRVKKSRGIKLTKKKCCF